MITTLAGSTNAGFCDGPAALFNSPQGLAVGFDGTVYIADAGNDAIRVYGTNGLNTLAGYLPGTNNTTPVAGATDGANGMARFNSPRGLIINSQGNLLVADTMNHAIRQVTPAGVVTTLAGTLGQGGHRNGMTSQAAFAAARFWHPRGIAVDSNGNLYVADEGNQALRKLSPIGQNWRVSTIGGPTNGLALPAGVTVDSSGNVYVADAGYDEVWQFTPVAAGWTTNSVAGGSYGQNDGLNDAAQFYFPSAIALDSAGDFYVADTGNSTIRSIRRAGSNWQVVTIAGTPGTEGFANGTNQAALFNWPYGIAVDTSNTVYVADTRNGLIRKMTLAGTNWVVTTIAGSPSVRSGINGTNSAASFGGPAGIAVDLSGNLYVADTGANTIRRLSLVGTNWVVTTIAGLSGQSGAADGTNTAATFNQPFGIALDSNGTLYVADLGNNTIRRLAQEGTNWVVTTIAGSPVAVYQDTYADTPDIAQFWTPEGLALGSNGLVYVTDRISRMIRTINTNGLVSSYPNSPGLSTLAMPCLLTGNAASFPSSLFGDQLVSIAAGGEPEANYGGAPYTSFHPVNHALGLYVNGTVTNWGNNTYGQCNLPAGLTNVVAIAAGGTYSLAATADGAVVGWGTDNGNGPYSQFQTIVAGATGFEWCCPPVAGSSHSLAVVNAGGDVRAWGKSYSGESDVPGGLSNVVSIASGLGHSLALTANGSVTPFGSGVYESLGYDNNGVIIQEGPGGVYIINSLVVSQMPAGLTNVVAIADSYAHALALKSDGTVVAWGQNPAGECSVPSGLSNVVAIAAGRGVNIVVVATNYEGVARVSLPTGSHSLALRSDGTVICWGNDGYAQCNFSEEVSNVVAISAGGGVSFALQRDGTVLTWGDNTWGLRNVAAPSQAQSGDTLAMNAAVQLLTAAVVMPDGHLLVADRFGLRLFDYSSRIQKQAAAWLLSELGTSGSSLNTAAQTLTAWKMLLQDLALYGLNSALVNDDALHALLFGNEPVADSTTAATFLSQVRDNNWLPTHSDLGTTALQQIDVLQSLLLKAVLEAAPNPNPASLPLVTDTLTRLKLLLARHDQPIPCPVLGLVAGTNHTVQVFLDGYPYVHYVLEASSAMKTWTTNSTTFRESGSTTVSTAYAPAKFFRATQTQ